MYGSGSRPFFGILRQAESHLLIIGWLLLSLPSCLFIFVLTLALRRVYGLDVESFVAKSCCIGDIVRDFIVGYVIRYVDFGREFFEQGFIPVGVPLDVDCFSHFVSFRGIRNIHHPYHALFASDCPEDFAYSLIFVV